MWQGGELQDWQRSLNLGGDKDILCHLIRHPSWVPIYSQVTPPHSLLSLQPLGLALSRWSVSSCSVSAFFYPPNMKSKSSIPQKRKQTQCPSKDLIHLFVCLFFNGGKGEQRLKQAASHPSTHLFAPKPSRKQQPHM